MPADVIDALSGLSVPGALCLGASAVALIALVLAFAPANAAYFDPRRADESERVVPVLLVVGPALHDVRQAARRALRGTAVTVAALLSLTIPTGDPR